MAGLLMDAVAVDHDAVGTTVTLSRVLRRPVSLHASVPAIAPCTTEHDFATAVDGALMELSGAVDAEAADELRVLLARHASGGGHAAVDVELSAVTVLSSAGVQVLFDALEQAAAQRVELRLRASIGSVAQHVLDLVRLPRHGREDALDVDRHRP
jgi:anti-anti-sigma factor